MRRILNLLIIVIFLAIFNRQCQLSIDKYHTPSLIFTFTTLIQCIFSHSFIKWSCILQKLQNESKGYFQFSFEKEDLRCGVPLRPKSIAEFETTVVRGMWQCTHVWSLSYWLWTNFAFAILCTRLIHPIRIKCCTAFYFSKVLSVQLYWFRVNTKPFQRFLIYAS